MTYKKYDGKTKTKIKSIAKGVKVKKVKPKLVGMK
jgi:hypothetical protein